MLKTFVRNCISTLPPNARRNIEQVAFTTMETVRNWNLDSEVIKGRISGQHLRGSVIYFGEPSQYRSWIAKFLDHPQISGHLDQFRILDIARFGHGLSKYDLAICPVNPVTEVLFSDRRWNIIPRSIDWMMNLRKPRKEIFGSRHIKDEKRILRKLDYTFKVTKSESALTEFYDEMLIPTVKKRHKELAYISRFEDLREKLKNGFLLCAYRKDEWVGAELVVRESSKIVRAANIGWRNGDDRLLRDHINSAFRFELIHRLKTEGCEYLNLGNSLPFVNDGIFQFKTKWGFKPVMPGFDFETGKVRKSRGFYAVYFNLASKCGQAMLQQNPVLERYGHILRIVTWDSQPGPEIRRLIDNGIPWIDLANI